VNLPADDIRAAYYCAAAVIRSRQRTGAPIPDWLRRHFDQLDTEIRASSMSRSGHQFNDAVRELASGLTSPIGADEAAQILGISKRQAQRLAADLGARLVGGRWLFERDVVDDYAEGRNQTA
jgi:hypothetical protein